MSNRTLVARSTADTLSSKMWSPSSMLSASGVLPASAEASPSNDGGLEVSIVVPMYNEQDNVERVVPDLLANAMHLNRSFEIIITNDGSTDDTGLLLDLEAAKDRRIKVIHFTRNYGQTAAMAAGFAAAKGEIIVPLDGDGQNEAGDIGKLLDKLDEGYGCVSGWRKDRKDDPIRVIPSQIANKLISYITGVQLHDYGCSLKAFRAKYIKPAKLYGEMHRFLPVYAKMNGAKIAEVEVGHHRRKAGQSKYGMSRTFRVVTDLFLLRVLQKFATRPSHFIGRFAWMTWGVGAFITLTTALRGLLTLSASPMPAVAFVDVLLNLVVGGLMSFLAGMIFVCIGIVAELVTRAKFEAANAVPWEVERMINFPDPKPESTKPLRVKAAV